MAIAFDASRNVYVTGSSYDGTTESYFTVSYDATGVEQWRQSVAGSVQGGVYARALGVDAAGNVYVTGYGGVNRDCLTVAYAPNGSERWRATCNLPGSPYSEINSLAVDAAGNIYVGGLTWVISVPGGTI